MSDKIKQLEKLGELLTKGEISDKEFQERKTQILGLGDEIIKFEKNKEEIAWYPNSTDELYSVYKPWKQGYNKSGIFIDNNNKKHFYKYRFSEENKSKPTQKPSGIFGKILETMLNKRLSTVSNLISGLENCQTLHKGDDIWMLNYRDMIGKNEAIDLLNELNCPCHKTLFDLWKAQFKLDISIKTGYLRRKKEIAMKYVSEPSEVKKKQIKQYEFPDFDDEYAKGWSKFSVAQEYFMSTHPRKRERHKKEWESILEEANRWWKVREKEKLQNIPIEKNGIKIENETIVYLKKVKQWIKAYDKIGKDYSKAIGAKTRQRAFNNCKSLKAQIYYNDYDNLGKPFSQERGLKWIMVANDLDIEQKKQKHGERFGKAIYKGKILKGMTEEMVQESIGKPSHSENLSIVDDKKSSLIVQVKLLYFGNPFNYQVTIKNNAVEKYEKLKLGVWENMSKKTLEKSYGKPYKKLESSYKGQKTLEWYYELKDSKNVAINITLEDDIVVGYRELDYLP